MELPHLPYLLPISTQGKALSYQPLGEVGQLLGNYFLKSPFLLVILELNDNCPKSKTALAKVLLPQGKNELGSWAVIFQNFYINNFIRPYINNFYFFQLKKLKVITQLPKCSFYQQGQGFWLGSCWAVGQLEIFSMLLLSFDDSEDG